MKKNDLAARLAERVNLSTPAAADQLDRLVNRIIEKLRHGEKVSLPGLGTFTPGPQPKFHFEPPKAAPEKSRAKRPGAGRK